MYVDFSFGNFHICGLHVSVYHIRNAYAVLISLKQKVFLVVQMSA